MFEFRYNGKTLCVDAARDDNSLGRLVNDDHISPNSKMQRITVDRQPHLCLFATKDIEPGEETTYNYGDFDFPWRLKVSTEAQPHDETAVTDCAKVDQISTEEQPDEAGVTDFTKADQKCKHQVVYSHVSSLDKCAVCFGPLAALRWTGMQCNEVPPECFES
ncbi:uncharacterized protein LOC144008148 isoform X2 [Festucalex cinctus]